METLRERFEKWWLDSDSTSAGDLMPHPHIPDNYVGLAAQCGWEAYKQGAEDNQCVVELPDTKRLNFLDGNLCMKMGWAVALAPAGNISVKSVIQPNNATSIRDAIDSAIEASGVRIKQ